MALGHAAVEHVEPLLALAAAEDLADAGFCQPRPLTPPSPRAGGEGEKGCGDEVLCTGTAKSLQA
jgi:hypothetical protein